MSLTSAGELRYGLQTVDPTFSSTGPVIKVKAFKAVAAVCTICFHIEVLCL
jgi:hypothetical protein